MAEQVNQRIESMIGELEQMRRTNLYQDEEIKEISRKRKEFEYRIQRRMKAKDDFVQYIAFELALLEDIVLRRKQLKMTEKKRDIEFAIAGRVNKVFKQFLFRFQDDIAIYFEYLKFCRSVGFDFAVSSIIGQMLQIHGDKPKAWQLASYWEKKEANNLENAASFLLKGIHRHPEADFLYLDLFEIELTNAFKAENDEDKEKSIKKADIVWRNGLKNITDIRFLFKICDIALKYAVDNSVTDAIKREVWSKRSEKEVWTYIAEKELEGYHWEEVEEFVTEEFQFPEQINFYIAAYEEALKQIPDKKLLTKYIHGLLAVNNSLCSDLQQITAVKHAWYFGLENGLLDNDMYEFGFNMLKLDDLSNEELSKILQEGLRNSPQCRFLWEENLSLHKNDENKMLSIIGEAGKSLKSDDLIYLWNYLLDNLESQIVFKNCYKRFQNCESSILLSLKPKFLMKIYEHNGLKAAREVYEDFVRTPPTQVDVHDVMIQIELSQEKPALKNIRKCFECAIQHHGQTNINVWMDYIKFETQNGNLQSAPAIHRRAIAVLNKDVVSDFLKAQALAKLK
ncbi:U3 small nucleolar RNA-associated protein 6 homolog [Aricia agestis]|uniref:U3 small nucleolar RNA-associated protein 6 homolog n=1 Tax=Aricia agestis TaxID=91739 RepID=UPI001C20BC45|nr:U3 small nucleolar RNA-associated protein 6 homolog [Aricia agestis]